MMDRKFVTVEYGVTGWRAVLYEWHTISENDRAKWERAEELAVRKTALCDWREIRKVAKQWAHEIGVPYHEDSYIQGELQRETVTTDQGK